MRNLVISLFFIVLLSSFVLASSSLHDTIFEGETKKVTLNGLPYSIKLVMVADNTEKSIFEVNGKKTKALASNQGYDFLDGSKIRVGEVFLQEGGDGPDMVEFYFYASAGTQSTIDEEYAISSIDAPAVSIEKVSYEDLSQMFQTRQTIPISEQPQLSAPEISVDEEYDKYPVPASSQPQKQTPAPAKKGFFSSILNWFLDFFR